MVCSGQFNERSVVEIEYLTHMVSLFLKIKMQNII